MHVVPSCSPIIVKFGGDPPVVYVQRVPARSHLPHVGLAYANVQHIDLIRIFMPILTLSHPTFLLPHGMQDLGARGRAAFVIFPADIAAAMSYKWNEQLFGNSHTGELYLATSYYEYNRLPSPSLSLQQGTPHGPPLTVIMRQLPTSRFSPWTSIHVIPVKV